MGVKIISDSAADIPEVMVQELGIKVLPLKITYDGKTYRDGVDIKSVEFFNKMKNENIRPTTSQVSPNDFIEAFKEEVKEGNQIISIHLSSKTSGTYQSASLAKDSFDNADITVIDSEFLSFAYGSFVVIAAQMAKEGKTKEEIIKKINYLRDKTEVIFCVDDLEYIKRGGRISKAAATLGQLLSIKPILYMKNGQNDLLDKVRGSKKAIPKMVELIKDMEYDSNYKFYVLHANCKDKADELIQALKEEFGVSDIPVFDIGCVIGSHVGPGTVGLTFIKK